MPDLSSDHPQFFKIHQTIHLRVVALVKEGEVFFDDRKQRNDGRLEVVLVEKVAVFGHVARRVEHILEFFQKFLVFSRQAFPCGPQSRDGWQIKPADDGEHGVEVLAVAAVKGDLYKVLDDLHSFGRIAFLYDLCGDPEGLLVHKTFEVAKVAGRIVWAELKEVNDVIGWFDAREEKIVAR